MYNLFKRPIEKATLEDWAKLTNNIAQIAVLAVPVVIYGADSVGRKIFNLVVLVFIIYTTLQSGRPHHPPSITGERIMTLSLVVFALF
ncbi:MAG: hypothetical protein Q4D82_04325, partial [Neisseria sp.]|nr:hypothetical protein [Neisseria sp.]